jgi:hypothetical protein
MKDHKKNIGNIWQLIKIMEHQKKAPKPTTHHESQKELWNDSTNHPNHGNLGTPEMLPTHNEGQEEHWNQLAIRPNHGNLGGLEINVQMMKTNKNMHIVQIMET